MSIEEFQYCAGGVFTYTSYYDRLNGQEKKRLFWGFFDERLQMGRKRRIQIKTSARSVYAGVSVEHLLDKEKYSIEHIVPQDKAVQVLSKQGKAEPILMGATCNPFNFMPCHRYLNAKRSQRPFDFDGDEIVLTYPIALPARYSDYGIDKDDQWVVPLMTRGDVARSILYMCIIYDLFDLYQCNLETLLAWAKNDKPSLWEIKYNEWIWKNHSIRNPFIQYPSNQALHDSLRLLDDEELLFSFGRDKPC